MTSATEKRVERLPARSGPSTHLGVEARLKAGCVPLLLPLSGGSERREVLLKHGRRDVRAVLHLAGDVVLVLAHVAQLLCRGVSGGSGSGQRKETMVEEGTREDRGEDEEGEPRTLSLLT
jgi:hypothetical protein